MSEHKQELSTKEAAAYLGVHFKTIAYHIYNSGRLKGRLITPRCRVFTIEELDAFRESDRKSGPRPKQA